MKPNEIQCPVCNAKPLFPCENYVRRSNASGILDEGRMEEIPEIHKERKRAAALETLRENQDKVNNPNRTGSQRSYSVPLIKPGGSYTPRRKAAAAS